MLTELRQLDAQIAEALGFQVITDQSLPHYSTDIALAMSLPMPEGVALEIYTFGGIALVRLPITVSSRSAEAHPEATTCKNDPAEIAATICRLWLPLYQNYKANYQRLPSTIFGVPVVVVDVPDEQPRAGKILRVLSAEEAGWVKPKPDEE